MEFIPRLTKYKLFIRLNMCRMNMWEKIQLPNPQKYEFGMAPFLDNDFKLRRYGT